MRSEGTFGRGVEEVKDVRAALGRAQMEAPGPVFLCGWSFGAHVALRTAPDEERVAALGLVALPLHESGPDLPDLPRFPSPERLASFDRPVLLLAGDHDPYCPVPELLVIAGRIPASTVEIVSRANHYFAQREREAGRIVAEFAERSVGGSPGAQ